MSKLLLNEQPLLVMPQLAVKIGLNESLVLQQIHYWLEINKKAKVNFHDDYHWTYNTYKEWQEQFPFWSIKTIQRTITVLEKLKLVIVGNYNKKRSDRTKWYRINYFALETLETSPFGQIDLSNRTKWLHHLDKMTNTLPENTKEITEDISCSSSTITQEGKSDMDIISLFEAEIRTLTAGTKKRLIDAYNYNPRLMEEVVIQGGLCGAKSYQWVENTFIALLEKDITTREAYLKSIEDYRKDLANKKKVKKPASKKSSFTDYTQRENVEDYCKSIEEAFENSLHDNRSSNNG